MRSIFTPFNAKLFIAIVCLFTTNLIHAQNFSGTWGKTNGPCIAPQSGCLNPDNITFTNTINTTTTASAIAGCNPLNSWTSIDYTFSTPQDLSGNNLLVTFNGNFDGKYALIQLQDNAGALTTYNFNYVLSIPQANTSYQYSVDFHPVASATFHLNTVAKIKIMLYNAQTAGSYDATTNFTGNLTITYSSDNKKSGEVDLVPSSVSQVWVQEANNLLYNPIGSGVLLGATPSQIDPKFLFPYYSLTIKGRTNIFGNDNAFEIWSNNVINGKRHYLGIGNYTFSDNTEYSLINAGEYGTVGYNSKHLLLQNNSGNIGIGTFTKSPLAKFQVNGNVLVGIRQPLNYTNYSLAVDGLIVSQRAVVTSPTNWADFVFKSSYKRPSLEDQEKFIQENGHLKDIPSETEVMAIGYDLSAMDAKFLQKMEELYLYTIELKKELDNQRKIIEQQQKQINDLKNR